MTIGIEGVAERDLGALDEGQLIECALAARDRGDRDRMAEALGRLAYGRYSQLVALARMHVGDEHEAEDIAAQAIAAVLRSALGLTAEFDGSSVGEFVNWTRAVVRRRAIDHRRRNVPTPIAEVVADAEGSPDGEYSGALGRSDDDLAEVIAIRDAYRRVTAKLSPTHREVVRLCIEERYTAGEVSAAISTSIAAACDDGKPPEGELTEVSEANAYKIVSRFRAEMHEILYGGG